MNSIRSLLRTALMTVFALVLLTGCDSVDVNHEAPVVDPFSGIDIPEPDFFARANFSYEVPVAGKTLLRLKGYNGHVEIKCLSDATAVTVTGERRVGSDSQQDADAYLDSLNVRVEDLGDEVFVHTIHPKKNENKYRQFTVDYSITIPQDLAVSVDQMNGLVSVEDLHESASVTLVNGTIEGAISLPLNGTIDLTTINGNINLTLPMSTSADFSASTGNGTVSVSNLNLQGGTNSLRSKSGMLGAGEGTITLRTSNGHITVTGQ